MTTAAASAYGISFKAGAGTVIAEVTSSDGPNIDRDMIEVTNMQSTSMAKEFIGGLIDFGEISLELNYLPSNQTHKDAITALTRNTAATAYTLTLPAGGTQLFTGLFIVKSFKMKGAVADKLSATVTFKATGPFTVVPV
jgi:predicted secreted protein